MRKTKFTEEQIALAIHIVDDGMTVEEVCRWALDTQHFTSGNSVMVDYYHLRYVG